MRGYLRLIPERDERIPLEEGEKYYLLIPMESPLDFIARKLHGEYRRIELDEIGAFIWRMCDGKKTVEEIGVLLKKRFGDRVEPIHERLVVFLLGLYKRHLITFKKPGDKTKGGGLDEPNA